MGTLAGDGVRVEVAGGYPKRGVLVWMNVEGLGLDGWGGFWLLRGVYSV